MVAAVVLAVVALGDGDDEPTTRGTGSPATVVPRATTLPTTTLPPSTTASPARRYVGLERDQGALPTAVTEVGGTFLIPDYGVAWVQGPEGTMFWLERVVATGPDGSVSRWRVVDVVTPPPLRPNTSDVVVVLGGTRCEVNGSPSSDVVGVFANAGQEWMDVPRVVWQVDRAAGRLVPLTASVRCINEGYGV